MSQTGGVTGISVSGCMSVRMSVCACVLASVGCGENFKVYRMGLAVIHRRVTYTNS